MYSRIYYAIYVDDGCNEGFYEEDRFDKISIAFNKLHELRKENKFNDYWLVVILDE